MAFGRVIGVDLGLVIPDEGGSLGEGAISRGRPRVGGMPDDLERL